MKKRIIAMSMALMLLPASLAYAEVGDEYAEDASYEEDYYEDYSDEDYYEDDYYDDADYEEDYTEDDGTDPFADDPLYMDIQELRSSYQSLENRVRVLEEQLAALTGTTPPSAPAPTAAPAPSEAPKEEPSPAPAEPAAPASEFDNLEWVDGIPGVTLTGEYAYPEAGTDSMKYVLFFRNENTEDVSFVCRAVAKDAAGNVISTSEDAVVRVAGGLEIPVDLVFTGLSFYDVIGINYSVAAYEADEFKSAQKNLVCETAQEGDILNMTMTAKDTAVTDAKAFVAVFLDDRIVAHGTVDFVTKENTLEPDMPVKQSFAIPAGVEYNRYRIFATGYYKE